MLNVRDILSVVDPLVALDSLAVSRCRESMKESPRCSGITWHI